MSLQEYLVYAALALFVGAVLLIGYWMFRLVSAFLLYAWMDDE